jgi:hypothetical protein
VLLDVVAFAGLPLVGVLLQFVEEFFRVFRFLELAVWGGAFDPGAVGAGAGWGELVAGVAPGLCTGCVDEFCCGEAD